MTKKRAYVIVSPPYVHYCGGIRSLHALARDLVARGEEVYITGQGTPPQFNVPCITTCSQEKLRELQHEGIIVYPDIVGQNPARFTHACKIWLGATQPPPVNQIVFAFSDMHQVVTKCDQNIFSWYIEDFFTEPPPEQVRAGTCTYAGKGSGIDHSAVVELTGNADNSINPSGSIRITAGFPTRREQLAALFKRSEVLYCYDNLSVIMTEARLCGCPVVLMGHWVLPEKDFKEKDEFGTDGIGFYGEPYNLEELRSQLPKFKERYQKRIEKTEIELDNFIKLTQAWNLEGIYVEDTRPEIPNDHLLNGHKCLDLWKTRG